MLAAGVPLVILSETLVQNPASLANALAAHQVTHFVAVPTLLHVALPHITGSPVSGYSLICHAFYTHQGSGDGSPGCIDRCMQDLKSIGSCDESIPA